MEQRSRSILIGVITVLIVSLILGGAFYLGRAYRNRSSSSTADVLNLIERRQLTPTPGNQADNTPASNTKTYLGDGFKVNYPQSWGLLTCSNTSNLEFDPTNPADAKGVRCNYALKPVTILTVNNLSCTGEKVTIGANQVTRLKTNENGDIDYRWCVTLPGKDLDITHRVSQTGSQATSTTDFSAQVEQMISTIQAASGS